MKEVKMSISVNGESKVPPGFRFHPTEEELLHYYLRKKVAYHQIDLDVIKDVDLNKLEPWDIQETCKIGSTPQNEWYFFSHKDKKYPTGTRTNRATAAGFWKATGRDKVIYSNSRRIGMRKTLVFYKGRAPHGLKSDWIMHEYRLLDDNFSATIAADHVTTAAAEANNFCFDTAAAGEGGQEEGGWVVCRIFKKKNHLKTTININPFRISSSRSINISTDEAAGALDQLLEQYKEEPPPPPPQLQHQSLLMPNYHCSFFSVSPISPEFTTHLAGERFMKLPNLESPDSSSCNDHLINSVVHQSESTSNITTDWATLDRLAATYLNGGQDDKPPPPPPSPPQLPYFGTDDTTMIGLCCPQNQDLRRQNPSIRSLIIDDDGAATDDYHTQECEFWSFGRPSLSSSDPLSQIS